MASQAAILIAQLQSQGYSKNQIARTIGRDSSYISQIASGKKSGASFVPALENMTRGNTNVNVPRRKTKAGNQARVRGGAIRDENNRVINVVVKTPDGAYTRNLLRQVQSHNGLIGVVITFKRYQAYDMAFPAQMDVPLWSNGTSAKWINNTMSETGLSFSELLLEQVNAAYQPMVASGIMAIQINAVY